MDGSHSVGRGGLAFSWGNGERCLGRALGAFRTFDALGAITLTTVTVTATATAATAWLIATFRAVLFFTLWAGVSDSIHQDWSFRCTGAAAYWANARCRQCQFLGLGVRWNWFLSAWLTRLAWWTRFTWLTLLARFTLGALALRLGCLGTFARLA